MIYSTPRTFVATKFIASTTLARRIVHLSLPVFFCGLLMGCDAQSSSGTTFNSPTGTKDASDSRLQTLISEEASAQEQQDSDGAVENENSHDDEGQSLIAIAKSDDKVHSATVSDESASSTLQATLIGDYMGMMPCSFCDGIALTLNLFSDGSVSKTSIYQNPETPSAPLVESGVYRQDDDTIIIVYEDRAIESYRIQNNHLLMLDENKNPDPDYTLSRK